MRALRLVWTCLVYLVHGRRVQMSQSSPLTLWEAAAVEPNRRAIDSLASLFLVPHPTLAVRGRSYLPRCYTDGFRRKLHRFRPKPRINGMLNGFRPTGVFMTGTLDSRGTLVMDVSESSMTSDLAGKVEDAEQEKEPQSTVNMVESIIDDLGQAPLSYHSRQMFYLPTEQLPALSARGSEVNVELVERIIQLEPDLTGDAASYFRVVKALLFYGAGALDEAQNLVLPLCWHETTTMGGPPIRNVAAAQEAAYTNALVHRQEGDFLSQWGNGQAGWENAQYWFAQAGEHQLYPDLAKGADEFVHGRYRAPASAALRKHMSEHEDSWSAESFVDLTRGAVESEDKEALEFCSHMMNLEWRLLLEHCWAKVKPHL